MALPTILTTWYMIAIIFSVALSAAFASDPAPGPFELICAFTYNNRFYILGGNSTNNATSPFAYTDFPLDLSQPVVWHNATPNKTLVLLSNFNPCVVTTNGTLLVGGNDFVGYDIENDKWLGSMHFDGTIPTLYQNWWSMFERMVQINDSLWIFEDFGNLAAAPGSNIYIYILNMTTFTWTTNEQIGEVPPALAHTALCYVPSGTNGMNETIFMLGGQSAVIGSTSTQYNQTIWMFDLNTHRWTLATQQLPYPVDSLYLSYYAPERTIYAFPGGTTGGAISIMQVINLTASPFQTSNFLPPNQQFQPSPRYRAGIAQQGNTIVVYGGHFRSQVLNDLQPYIFDMATGSWTQKAPMAATGTLSTASARASSTITSTLATVGTNPDAASLSPLLGLLAGVIVAAIALVISGVGFLIYRKKNKLDGETSETTPSSKLVKLQTSAEIMEVLLSRCTLNNSGKKALEKHKGNFPNDEEKLRWFLLIFDIARLADYLVWIPYHKFTILTKIGEGGFSIVYKATVNCNLENDRLVALKVMKARNPSKDLLRNELIINTYLRFNGDSHRLTTPPLIGLSKDDSGCYMLVMEYAAGGNLENILREYPPDSWLRVWQIATGITQRLQTIHQLDLIHFDLHPGNIVFNGDIASANPMIIDVGICKAVEVSYEHGFGVYGRLEYLPPEAFKKLDKHFSQKFDIYCLGTLLWQLTSRSAPRETAASPPKIASAAGLREVPIPGTPEAYENVYKMCWNPDPDMRPSADEVLDSLLDIEMELANAKWLNEIPEAVAYIEKLNTKCDNNYSLSTLTTNPSRHYTQEEMHISTKNE